MVGADGQVYGPVDMATLQQWIAEGRILPSTELVDPLDGHRLPASSAPALMGLFPDAGSYLRPPVSAPADYGYPRPGMMSTYAGPPKSKVTTLLLAIFLGGLGVHRFYLGHTAMGIGMLALFGLGFLSCGLAWIPLGIWSLVDIILIAVGNVRDSDNQPLGP